MHAVFTSFLVATVSIGSVFMMAYAVTAAEHTSQFAMTRATLETHHVTHSDSQTRPPQAQILPGVAGAQFTQKIRTVEIEQNEEQTETQELIRTERAAEQGQVREEKKYENTERVETLTRDQMVEDPPVEAVIEPVVAEALVDAIFDLTNQVREADGLAPLGRDDALSLIAQSHSTDMVTRSFFAHKNPDGCALECRLEAYGYTATAWAENISYVENSNLLSHQEAAKRIVESWMGSGPHRKNILSDSFTHTGVAFAYDGDDVYVSALYAQ